MAGRKKQTYKVQFHGEGHANGWIISIGGVQSHAAAKSKFIALKSPPKGSRITVWPSGFTCEKKNMRI